MAERETSKHGAAAGLRVGRAVRLVAILATAVGAAGCASVNEKLAGTLADMPAIGLPTGVPERPADQYSYPAVHDMPPPRAAAVLSEVEQQKMEDDLVAAREAQKASTEDKPSQKKPARPRPRAVPVSSRSTIY